MNQMAILMALVTILIIRNVVDYFITKQKDKKIIELENRIKNLENKIS